MIPQDAVSVKPPVIKPLIRLWETDTQCPTDKGSDSEDCRAKSRLFYYLVYAFVNIVDVSVQACVLQVHTAKDALLKTIHLIPQLIRRYFPIFIRHIQVLSPTSPAPGLYLLASLRVPDCSAG